MRNLSNRRTVLLLLGSLWVAASGFTSCGGSGGFTGPALIEVNPVEVDIVASLGAGNPAPQTVTVVPATTRYSTSIAYEGTPPASWLSATLDQEGSEITLTASLSGLTPGTYRATVNVIRRGATTEFYVQLTVTP